MPLMLLRFWREGVMGVLLVALGITWMIARANDRRADKWQQRSAETQAAFDVTVQGYRAAAEKARADDLANKVRVEAQQDRTAKENEDEIRRRIAAAVAAVRVRTGPSTADTSGRRGPAVPGTPNASSSPDRADTEAVVPTADLEICATNTIVAEGWQNWYEAVRAIPR